MSIPESPTSPTDPGRAPLANTNVLLIVSPGRLPLATCGPTSDPDTYRLSLEILGHGYGVNVHLRGALPMLRTVVTDLSGAIDQAQPPEGGDQP
jgi:hypothetical protein